MIAVSKPHLDIQPITLNIYFCSAPPDFSNSEVSLNLAKAGQDRRSMSSTATPSPRKQSIEDLASSVENLKEKLLRLPFAVSGSTTEVITEGEENQQQPPPPPLPRGSLSRSRYYNV